jgi:REP element-mobilizing transposase RayT
MYRKHLRLKEFDYSSENYYFVTVCTDYRRKLFDSKLPGMRNEENVVRTSSSPMGQATNVAEKVLLDLPNYYTNLVIDLYVFMSDHIHIIFGFEGKVTLKAKPTTSRHYTLGDIVGIFKQVATKQLHRQLSIKDSIFQPNFYEHVIRNEKSLEKIREYIVNNPAVEHSDIFWEVLDPK